MPDDHRPTSAGVHFPPPLVYLLGAVAGWGLQQWIRWPITAGFSRVRLLVAALFVLGYLVLFVSALLAFRQAHTTLIPNRPAAALVATGPYRFTRNPMYLSLVCLYMAGALWLNTWWAVVVLPVVVVVIDRAVIAREERYLASAFPAEYEAYRGRVRRWL